MAQYWTNEKIGRLLGVFTIRGMGVWATNLQIESEITLTGLTGGLEGRIHAIQTIKDWQTKL